MTNKAKFMLALAAATAGASAAQGADEWAGKPVPIEVFGQFPQLETPRISPDGKWIAAKLRAAGGQSLAIIPVGGGEKPRFITRDGAEGVDKQGDRQVREWRWLDADHLLILITYRENFAGDWFDNTRYAVFNRATGKTIPLGWTNSIGGTSVIWSSNQGRPHVLLQRNNIKNGTERWNRPEVLDIDADTGRESSAQYSNPIVTGWTADSAGVVRIGSSYDANSGRMRMIYRAGPNAGYDTVHDGETDRYDDLAVPAIMLSNGKSYAYSRKDGYRALYEYDLAGMKLGKKVFGIPGYDIDGALQNADRTALDGVSFTDQRQHTRYFDGRLGEIQDVLEERFGKGNVTIESADRPREKIVFSAAKPGQAPGFYLFDTVGGGIGLIGWQNETLKDAALNPVSTIRYTSSDGKPIEAVLTTPRARAGQKNLPLVVLPHGGPWARDSADWDPYQWAQAVAELGYVVVQPNFRGSTGYGRAWEQAAEGNWGYRMSDDLNDAVAYLAQQGIADPKRVCMFGWSYGGYAAARAAQRDGAKYRCAIAGAAPADMPAMVSYDKNYLGRYGAKKALGSASTNLADISPALHAGDVSTPLMIVHGAKDQRVPVAQARGFVARLKSAGKVEGRDFVYLEQPQNTHNLLREADRVELLKAVRDFLAKHNPA